jgi:hypothetical protein
LLLRAEATERTSGHLGKPNAGGRFSISEVIICGVLPE